MSLRELILNNIKWKIAALALAVFVWFLIQFAISEGFRPTGAGLTDTRTYSFPNQTVLLLNKPDSSNAFRVVPPRVDVTVRVSANILKRLAKQDIKAFVDLAQLTAAPLTTNEVFLYTPEGAGVFDVVLEPPAVTVERVEPSP